MRYSKTMLAFLMTMMVGQRLSSAGTAATRSEIELRLFEARTYLAEGKLAQAKEMTGDVLSEFGDDQSAQSLMAEIIDHEVQLDKSTTEEPLLSTQEDADQKRVEIEKWLERSRSYLSLHQYDAATLAAEKVFLYDAYNAQASRLLDDIRNAALKEGRHASQAMENVSQMEIENRIQIYRNQAKDWIEQGKWGSAKLAIEKILWLHPFDREALQMQANLKTKQSKDEKRKAF